MVAVGEVDLDRAGDGAQVDVAMGCAHVDATTQACGSDVASARIHSDFCGLGNRYREVELAAVVAVGLDQHGVAAHFYICGLRVEDLLCLAV